MMFCGGRRHAIQHRSGQARRELNPGLSAGIIGTSPRGKKTARQPLKPAASCAIGVSRKKQARREDRSGKVVAYGRRFRVVQIRGLSPPGSHETGPRRGFNGLRCRVACAFQRAEKRMVRDVRHSRWARALAAARGGCRRIHPAARRRYGREPGTAAPHGPLCVHGVAPDAGSLGSHGVRRKNDR